MGGRYESLAGSETTKKKQSDKCVCVIGPQRAWQSTIGRTGKDYEPSRNGHLASDQRGALVDVGRRLQAFGHGDARVDGREEERHADA